MATNNENADEPAEIKEAAREVLEDSPDAVREHLDDEDGALNYLVGKLMQRTGGAADPGEAISAIEAVIEEDAPEWPVSFTVYRRPVDYDTVHERLANELPSWADRPESVSDPTRFEFGFKVTVSEEGDVTITPANYVPE